MLFLGCSTKGCRTNGLGFGRKNNQESGSICTLILWRQHHPMDDAGTRPWLPCWGPDKLRRNFGHKVHLSSFFFLLKPQTLDSMDRVGSATLHGRLTAEEKFHLASFTWAAPKDWNKLPLFWMVKNVHWNRRQKVMFTIRKSHGHYCCRTGDGEHLTAFWKQGFARCLISHVFSSYCISFPQIISAP